MAPRLALGTAAFAASGYAGLPAVPVCEQESILDYAMNAGVRSFYVSPNYGEQIVSSCVPTDMHVTTKITGLARGKTVQKLLDASRRTLNRKFHILVNTDSVADFVLLNQLREAQARGEIGLVGATVYSVDVARAAIRLFDVVEVAYSLLDQRMEATFDLVRSRKSRLILRSVFLRGALTPSSAAVVPEHVVEEANRCRRRLLTDWWHLPEHALRFAMTAPATEVIVGPRSRAELRMNVAAWREGPLTGWRQWMGRTCWSEDERVVDPRLWK